MLLLLVSTLDELCFSFHVFVLLTDWKQKRCRTIGEKHHKDRYKNWHSPPQQPI